MRRAIVVALAGLTAGACTLEPRYVRPAPATPSTWPVGAAYPQATPAAAALSYREVFQDPRLQALIDQALASNQNLRAALANVEIARAQHRVRRADLLPSVDASGGAAQSRTRGGSGQAQTQRSYDASLSAAFQLDLFGRLRSLSRAAQEQYLATDAGARAARLTLVAEVAAAYATLAADRTLLAIARETVANTERSVALTEARLSGGVAARTDLAQAQTVLQQARSDLAELTTQVAQDRNALELLVGAPTPDSALPAGVEELEGRFGDPPAGLDSRILLARPDVLEAEHRLRSANAEIGAARAAFFPTISLTGLAGYASPALSSLFTGRNFTWRTDAGASMPIFAGGANVAGLAGARAERELALAQYQNAVQSAFRDVADALARRGTIDEQLAAEQALLAAARTSYELSSARYRAGVDPFLDTLVNQRSFYGASQSLTRARLAQALNRIALYEALGADPLIAGQPARTGAPPRS